MLINIRFSDLPQTIYSVRTFSFPFCAFCLPFNCIPRSPLKKKTVLGPVVGSFGFTNVLGPSLLERSCEFFSCPLYEQLRAATELFLHAHPPNGEILAIPSILPTSKSRSLRTRPPGYRRRHTEAQTPGHCVHQTCRGREKSASSRRCRRL